MVLKSRDYVFEMSVFKKLSPTVCTGTCVCSYYQNLSISAAVVASRSITASILGVSDR